MHLDMSFVLVKGDFETWKSCENVVDEIVARHGIDIIERTWIESRRQVDVIVHFKDEASLVNATKEITNHLDSKGLKEKCIRMDDVAKCNAKKVIEETLAA